MSIPLQGAEPGADNKSATGPLAGVRVLDLTQYILGPVATQILGDMGADIIKVEAPQGDQNRHIGPERYPAMAALFMGMNRNKRSVVLDLKRAEARDMLLQMVEEVDVFVHSLRPDAAVRLGIGPADIVARNPRIIYASAPGYRSDGPKSNAPAYDDVIQGESGIAGMTFLAHGEPRYLPTVIADKFCGYVLASSIGMALFHRQRTGEGQVVEVPMLETMLSFNLIEHLWTGNFDQPMGPLGYERAVMPHRRPFATSDGHICLMATTDLQWENLLTALGRPELTKDQRFNSVAARSARFPELYGIVGEEIAKRSTDEWETRLKMADIPHARAKKLEDLPTDPYLVETGFFHHYSHPVAGPIVTTSVPVKFSKSPPQLRRPPPVLGEHTDAVLHEFGFSDSDIAKVRA
jgi:crotonobetainyl-CoA:carnitine CoA-transferase CaiB-like acyl-CoA transferase